MTKKIRIGILSPSNIAEKRFLPALNKSLTSEFVGMAHASVDEWVGADERTISLENRKTKVILEKFNGKLFDSYYSLLTSSEIDAVYIPLPPSLHFKWAKLALENSKHVLLEKPATTKIEDTLELIEISKKNNLALHENYMFVYHNQINYIKEIIDSNQIGDIRLIRLSFEFPKRANNDFRYNKNLGGGALLDCGGYTIKYASMLLGETAEIKQAVSNYIDGFNVDIYGSAILKNEENHVVQLSFGMDNSYRCSIEVWGSLGSIFTNRVFTAPYNYNPIIEITVNNEMKKVELEKDDTFLKSIKSFENSIQDINIRENTFKEIEKQAYLIDNFLRITNN